MSKFFAKPAASFLCLLLSTCLLSCQPREEKILRSHQQILSPNNSLPESWHCFHDSGTGSGKYELSLRITDPKSAEKDYLNIEIQLSDTYKNTRALFTDWRSKLKKGRKHLFRPIPDLGDEAFYFKDKPRHIYLRRGNALLAIRAEKRVSSAQEVATWLDTHILTLLGNND